MGLRDSLTGLLGGRLFRTGRAVESHTTADRVDLTIDFVARPSIDAMITYLQDELRGLNADKVVVVSGFSKLASISGGQFAGYEYLYNSCGYFGWLLKVCEYMREAQHPQIIVSRFPRQWNPPKIKVVQANFDPNIFGIADGSIGGTVHEIEASAGSQFMRDPSKITLNVIDESDGDSTLALYFVGLYAVSYYREVLASQGCPPRKPLVCKVISGPSDPNLETTESKLLRSTDDLKRQSVILREASDKLEEFCASSAQRREKEAFSGGVLLPKFPQNEQLPLGARSAKTARVGS